MGQKGKSKKHNIEESVATTTLVDLDHVPLVDSLFKIVDAKYKFDFHELHLWLKQRYLDQQDPIKFSESLFPFFNFPKTHDFLDLIT